MVDLATNRMLSVALVQVGPALPLAVAAAASCFKLSSLHCTVRPRMKTASAIRGRHGVQDTTLHSSSSTHHAHEPFTFIYNLTTLTLCNATFLARNLFIYVSVPHAINIIQFNSIQFKVMIRVACLNSCRHLTKVMIRIACLNSCRYLTKVMIRVDCPNSCT